MTTGWSTRRTLLATGLAAMVAAPAALAHHGWSGYGEEDFSVSGIVEAVELGNPHDRLSLRNDEGLWNVVLGPPFRGRRAGVEEGVIEPGMSATAHGRRHHDPDVLEIKTELLEVEGRRYEIYPERRQAAGS